MSSIFHVDSPAMRGLAKVADIMLLNLLFIVTSLPLITLGASLTALNGTAIKIVTDECDAVTATYLKQFRANLRAGTLLGLVAFGLAVVLWAWFVMLNGLGVPLVVKIVLVGVYLVLGYRVFGTVAFMFGYQATFDDKFVRVLDNARRISARHPVATIQMLVTTVVPVVVFYFYPQVFLWGLVWVIAGFSGIAVLNATALVRVFRRYGLPT